MKEEINKFWSDFVMKHPQFKNEPIPKAVHFCDNEKDANELVNLVSIGKKTGTCGALSSFKYYKENLPKVGDLWIMTDFDKKPFCVTRTIKVDQIAFKDITESWAKKEGEGDLSLAYWRKSHWEFFERDLAAYGKKPLKDMILVCDEFEVFV